MNPQAKQIKTNSVRHATPCEPWVCLAWLTSVLGFAARPLPPPLQGDDDALRLWGHPMALCRNPAEAPGGWIYIYICCVRHFGGVRADTGHTCHRGKCERISSTGSRHRIFSESLRLHHSLQRLVRAAERPFALRVDGRNTTGHLEKQLTCLISGKLDISCHLPR